MTATSDAATSVWTMSRKVNIRKYLTIEIARRR
jgi:hypothetical protein